MLESIGDWVVRLCESVMPRVYSTAAFCWGALVGVVSYAVGGVDVAVQWLFTFMLIDYILGTLAACKTHAWSSATGFRGIIKKVIIFCVVAVCHGLDEVVGTGGALRSAAIIAYSINEVGSMLENLTRMGYGGIIPPVLQQSLQKIQEDKDLPTKKKGDL